MYIKRIDIQGFKSFADKVKLSLAPGISIVVGPNGSGKSNISDAIRWVLGEQSAKSLRGAKMEDIIFSGSSKRRPVGMAEVALTFDNSDGLLNIDYNEVTVTRRLYRSGESTFFINKRACRLKDLHELFMDIGVGKEAISIIGQGKVEEILNSKPEERRSIIEETAGIIKYRNRKRETLKKLEVTKQHLQRVRDLISEIEEQKDPLKNEAIRAEQYILYKSELDCLEIGLAVELVEKLEKKIEQVELMLDKQKSEGIRLNTEIATLESRIEDIQASYNRKSEEYNGRQKNVYEVINKIERLETTASNSRSRVFEYHQYIENLNNEISLLTAKINEIFEAEEALSVEQKQIKEKLNSKELGAEKLNQRYKEINQEYRQCEELLEESNSKIFELKSKTIESQNKQEALKEQIDRSVLQLDEYQLKSERLLTKQQDLKNQREDKQQTINQITVQIQDTEGKVEEDKVKAQQLKTTNESFLHKLGTIEKNINEKESRIKFLEELKENMEGYANSIKRLIQAKRQGNQELKEVEGVIGELIKVKPQHQKAIEVALGGAVQHVVTTTDTGAKRAISYLKRERAGRSTFLPLNTIRPNKITLPDQVRSDQGLVAIASQLVECDSRFQKAIEYILGRVVVAQDLDAANKLAKLLDYKTRIVTLEGEVINPGGSMTGGSFKSKTNSILNRDEDIKSLQLEVKDLLEVFSNYKKELREVNTKSEKLNEYIEEIENKKQDLRIKLHEYNKDMDQIVLEAKNCDEEIRIINANKVNLEQEIKRQREEIDYLNKKRNKLLEEEQSKNKQVEEIKSKLIGLKQQEELINKQLTEAKVGDATLKQTEIGISQKLNEIKDKRDEVNKSLEDKKAELEAMLAKMNKTADELEEAIIELEKALNKKSTISQFMDNLRDSLETEKEKLEQNSNRVKLLTKELKLVQESEHKLDIQVTKLRSDKENQISRLKEYFDFTYFESKDSAQCILNKREAAKRVKELKQKIDQLGQVNLGAIEEYNRLNTRYDFLSKQVADLDEAKSVLEDVIKEMDIIMTKRFGKAFAEINKELSKVFSDLFGGGQAELVLTEEDNLLETGIEINAQPPGKKLQNLSLLSGGERALTAIALLFAILKVKPSPFCILDEIEASLDEVNVSRFADFLQRFSSKTQFIVISHRRGTMEVADVLYGVTMKESGVSSLVSVKVTDEAI
ncbi:chromosome segregation protein [Desulfitispora alkaliphila]|uniref:chromosome segregation protein SMC n=1 Tax=Desulfitispora alkaliphila TaxID=622674 RepID=UPI003D2532C9